MSRHVSAVCTLAMILQDFVCVQLAVSVLGVKEEGMAEDSGKSTQYSPSILSHL